MAANYSQFKKNEKLQDYFINRLEETGSVKGAAELTCIGTDTAYRLMRSNTDFKEKADAARVQYAKNMAESFRKYSPEALDTLRQVMGNIGNPASARVAAAKAILDYSLNFDAEADLDEKITQLTREISDAELLLVESD